MLILRNFGNALMAEHEGDRKKLARKFFRKVRLPLHPLLQMLDGELKASPSVRIYTAI